jgi:HEAT repeat protein
VPRITALLKHRDFYVRIGAVLALSEIGCPLDVRARSGRRSPAKAAALVVDPLVIALADERPAVVRQAAETLSVMGQLAQAAVASASRMLDDPDPTRRTAAIGLITDLGPHARAAVPRLVQLQSTWDSRHVAALAAIGPAAAEAVDALVQDANRHAGSRRADALQALAFMRSERSDLDDIIKLLEDPDSNAAAKQHVLKRLAQLGARAAPVAEDVKSLLESGEFSGWEQAAREFLESVRTKQVPGIAFDW